MTNVAPPAPLDLEACAELAERIAKDLATKGLKKETDWSEFERLVEAVDLRQGRKVLKAREPTLRNDQQMAVNAIRAVAVAYDSELATLDPVSRSRVFGFVRRLVKIHASENRISANSPSAYKSEQGRSS